MNRLQRLERHIFDSPTLKTLLSALSVIGTGVFVSSFIVEISTPAGLAWGQFYKAPSFYVLAAFVILLFWYNRALYRYETAIERFLDNDYCKAYMRSQCLPEAAERYREVIRNGDIGELTRAMNEVRKILK